MCSIGPITDIAIAGYHSCAIVNGQVKSWGGRVNDNLGFQGSSTKNAMTLDNLQDKRPTRLFTNGYGCHTFIINDDKTVYGVREIVSSTNTLVWWKWRRTTWNGGRFCCTGYYSKFMWIRY
jgi:hypothetical protein